LAQFDQTSEEALLSILINNPELGYNLQDIKEGMFSSESNGFLFSIIQEIIHSGNVPEISLILTQLKSRGKVGDKDYLNYISKQTANKDNLLEYEKNIVESWKAKNLVMISTSVQRDVLSGQDVNIAISSLRSKLDDLTKISGGSTTELLYGILTQAVESIKNRILNPGIKGVTSGLNSIDKPTYGMCGGKVWIIAGRPSMGKSASIANFALSQGELGIPNLIFSLEMSKQDISERLVAIRSGVDLTNIKLGLLTPEHMKRIEQAYEEVKSYPIYIDDNFATSINYILATTRKYVRTYGVKVIYIDYLQLLAERSADATNELGRISRALKLLARELDICVIALSQLNRNLEMRDDKRPIMSDLRASGNLEEDTDIAIGLYRDDVYNKDSKSKGMMEFIIMKNRDGAIGMLPIGFTPATCRLKEWS